MVLPVKNKFVMFSVLLNELVVQILKTQKITKVPSLVFSIVQIVKVIR